VLSGEYDLSRTAVLISQTGGGCRATNYIGLIRKALRDAGHPEIPVISLALAGGLDETNTGFSLAEPRLLLHAGFAILFGDVLMQCLYRTRPYEAETGSAERLFGAFMRRGRTRVAQMGRREFYRLCKETIQAFDELPLVNDRSKPRVGIVGEILVKFHPTANNELVHVLEAEGCEVTVPGLMDFFMLGMSNSLNMRRELGSKPGDRMVSRASIAAIEGLRAPVNRMLAASERFEPYASIFELGEKAEQVLSLCNNMGEGWLLTAEMIELIEGGAPNVVCPQPFACLPNHVVGKSVIKRLRQMHPESNIVAVDYDPGASEVNQLNRIKLMISVAKENLRETGEFVLEGDDVDALDAHGEVSGPIRLTPEQLEQIEAAKERAGVS
jgi:predicted nucleotide-binding protein (sugar kinase/HSP70/actin superfamily)